MIAIIMSLLLACFMSSYTWLSVAGKDEKCTDSYVRRGLTYVSISTWLVVIFVFAFDSVRQSSLLFYCALAVAICFFLTLGAGYVFFRERVHKFASKIIMLAALLILMALMLPAGIYAHEAKMAESSEIPAERVMHLKKALSVAGPILGPLVRSKMEYKLGNAYLENGDVVNAECTFQKLMAEPKYSQQISGYLLFIDIKREDFKAAIANVNNTKIDINKRMRHLTIISMLMGRYPEALGYAEKAIANGPALAVNYRAKGAVMRDGFKNYREALANFDKAIEMDGDDCLPKMQKAITLMEMHEYVEAETLFKQVAVDSSTDPMCTYVPWIAINNLRQGKPAQAALDYKAQGRRLMPLDLAKPMLRIDIIPDDIYADFQRLSSGNQIAPEPRACE